MEKNSSTRARTEIEKRCAAERRKLARFLSKNGLNEEKIKSLDPVILNVSWMKSKLDDARTAIGEDGITVEYDNGGGQPVTINQYNTFGGTNSIADQEKANQRLAAALAK